MKKAAAAAEAWKELKNKKGLEVKKLAGGEVARLVVIGGIDDKTEKTCFVYPQFNIWPNSKLNEYFDEVWMEEGAGLNTDIVRFHHLNSTSHGILCFVGGFGNWTPLHIDWTSAINIAFRIQRPGEEVNLEDPIARWYFFHPKVVPIVNKYLLKKKPNSKGLGCGKRNMPFLTKEDFVELQNLCGVDPKTMKPYAFEVLQFHGEWLEFEPGYLHQVETLVASVKFAWDTYRYDKLQMYINVWMYLISQFMGDDVAQDYMNILGLIESELLKACPLQALDSLKKTRRSLDLVS
ncbi:hypothetical protein Ndes2437A_g09150 [Nannochloris sp. 'desiccata']